MSYVCPSVYPFVTLVDQDHIGWKSWKVIYEPTSIFVAQTPSTYSPGEHGEILGRLEEEVGWEKWHVGAQASISLKHVKIVEKLLWGAYRNSPTLFRTVPSASPYSLHFHKIRGSQPPPKTSIVIISGTGKNTEFKFGQYIHRVHPTKNPLKILETTQTRERGRIQELPNVLKYPYLCQCQRQCQKHL